VSFFFNGNRYTPELPPPSLWLWFTTRRPSCLFPLLLTLLERLFSKGVESDMLKTARPRPTVTVLLQLSTASREPAWQLCFPPPVSFSEPFSPPDHGHFSKYVDSAFQHMCDPPIRFAHFFKSRAQSYSAFKRPSWMVSTPPTLPTGPQPFTPPAFPDSGLPSSGSLSDSAG